MEPNIFTTLWATIQPIFLAGCSLIGIGTVFTWLKKKGFIGEKHFDRRKDNSDTVNQFLRLAEQHNKVIQKLVEINDEQKDILKSMMGRQVEIRDKVNDIHGQIING